MCSSQQTVTTQRSLECICESCGAVISNSIYDDGCTTDYTGICFGRCSRYNNYVRCSINTIASFVGFHSIHHYCGVCIFYSIKRYFIAPNQRVRHGNRLYMLYNNVGNFINTVTAKNGFDCIPHYC